MQGKATLVLVPFLRLQMAMACMTCTMWEQQLMLQPIHDACQCVLYKEQRKGACTSALVGGTGYW